MVVRLETAGTVSIVETKSPRLCSSLCAEGQNRSPAHNSVDPKKFLGMALLKNAG